MKQGNRWVSNGFPVGSSADSPRTQAKESEGNNRFSPLCPFVASLTKLIWRLKGYHLWKEMCSLNLK